jgi:LmbE family N-acetylglucosaminyl deacetylase
MHRLPIAREPLRRILCLGAHCDDIDIGCGGTLLALSAANPELTIDWIVFTGSPTREAETEEAVADLLADVEVNLSFMSFSDGDLPGSLTAVKSAFRKLTEIPQPDLVFTHYRGDLHQDHRVIGELTWQTFRDHVIWEYEIPKYDGDIGRPNIYVPLDDATMDRKIAVLLDRYVSQRSKPWFSAETFRALGRLRGIEAGLRAGFAEAFYSSKTVIDL